MHLVGLSHVCVCAVLVKHRQNTDREDPATFCHYEHIATSLWEGAVQLASKWDCGTKTRRRKARDVESLTGKIA